MDTSPERRREPRVPSQGPVTLRASTPVPHTVQAEMVDESSSGMRIRHNDRMIETGAEVEFQTLQRQGRARIMWSRVCGSSYEAGLYILPGD
jgi:hypothetical protein